MGGDTGKGVWLTTIGAFWAAAYLIPYKAGTDMVAPEVLVLPMLLSAAVLNSLSLLFPKTHQPLRLDRTTLVVATILGLLAAVGNEAMARALALIGPGLAAVVLRSQVIFVALAAWWLMGERVSLRFWLGVLVAGGGIFLIQQDVSLGSDTLEGMLWVMVAAVTFGGMQVVVRKAVQRIQPLLVNSLRLWFAALLLACVPGRVGLLVQTDGWIWLLAAAAALCGPVLSRLYLMWALRYMPAALATLILFSAPVFAFVMGGLFFGVWPGLTELGGSLIILGGIALPVVEMLRKNARINPS